jgi:hypothetical protein
VHVHHENQLNVEARRDAALPDLLQELLNLRSQLISLVVPLSPEDLIRPVSVTSGQQVPTHALLGSSDRHAKAHIQILRGVAQ